MRIENRIDNLVPAPLPPKKENLQIYLHIYHIYIICRNKSGIN